jgi:DnaJ-class molecular chaperone
VDRNATVQDIKRRYREQIIRCHPDVASRHGLSVEQATEITRRVNWAYSVLKKHAMGQ